jgi:hypothetical protein
MTSKQAIYDAMRDVNGCLAWAREYVRNNDLQGARAQVDAAQIALALAKIRVEARMEEADA